MKKPVLFPKRTDWVLEAVRKKEFYKTGVFVRTVVSNQFDIGIT